MYHPPPQGKGPPPFPRTKPSLRVPLVTDGPHVPSPELNQGTECARLPSPESCGLPDTMWISNRDRGLWGKEGGHRGHRHLLHSDDMMVWTHKQTLDDSTPRYQRSPNRGHKVKYLGVRH